MIVARALAALTLFVLCVGMAAPAEAQGRIVARHGDWQIRCERPVGAPSEQCALVQNVEAEDRANVGLTVIFLRTADRQARILRVLAPLGVLLPSGLGLSIDENEVGLAGFVRCLPEGCIAEVELDDGLLERFGAGETATFVIFQTPEEGIGIPISLNGFSAGFGALDDPIPAEALASADPVPPAEAVPTSVARADADAAFAEFDEGDDRSALDRLLEDRLLPYVAATIVMVLSIVIATIVVLRARKTPPPAPERPRNPRPRTQTSASAPRRPRDDLSDLDVEVDVAPRQARLAAEPRPRQVTSEGPRPPKADSPRRRRDPTARPPRP